MFVNLMKMEIRRGYLSMLIWSTCVSLMVFLVIILYPMVIDIYASMPAEVQQIMEQFGGIPDNVLEYFATEGAMMMQIFGAIFAALLGFNMISRVERERVAEVLYTIPVSKMTFYLSKILAIFVFVFAFSFINYVVGYIGFAAVKESFDFMQYFTFTLLNMVMYLVIAYLGMFLALLFKVGTNNLLGIIIPLPFYIVTMTATMTDQAWLKRFKYVSPFTFSDPVEILKTNYDFEWLNFMIFIVLTLISLGIGFILYKKRITVK